jgi:hypothetical protein
MTKSSKHSPVLWLIVTEASARKRKKLLKLVVTKLSTAASPNVVLAVVQNVVQAANRLARHAILPATLLVQFRWLRLQCQPVETLLPLRLRRKKSLPRSP